MSKKTARVSTAPRSVLILTSHYPYPPGEQFLESEILAWVKHFDGRIVVMPRKIRGHPRDMPAEIVLSSALSDAYKSVFDNARAVAASVFQPILWKEIVLLHQRRSLTSRAFLGALKAVAHVMLTRLALEREEHHRSRPDLIYTYWFSFATYAAVASNSGSKIVTRAHGGDLYEDRSPDGHLYLRRQFLGQIDGIYVISDDAALYLRDRFLVGHNVRVSRLGVHIPEPSSCPSADDCISILSLSFCVPVKNIDRIIDGIRIAAELCPGRHIIWRHIGDGPLRATLEARAKQLFSEIFVDWRFLGHMENAEVLRFMEAHPIDFILNSSSSEGVPVSIMEAMARGIPAIAPDVGGISELVSNETGILLPAGASSEDIADAIIGRIDHLKSSAVRNGARKKVEKIFNSDVNYAVFIKDITEQDTAAHADVPQ